MEIYQIPNDVVSLLPDNHLSPFPQVNGTVSHNPPPAQKLLPIRGNGGRNLTEYADLESAGGVDGNLTAACFGGAELGFQKIGGDAAAAVAEQVKMEMDAKIMNLISAGRILEAEFSSSSDYDSQAIEGGMNRKRKRKTRKRLESFIKRMTTKLMLKQEEMHNQLMEILEKNERERMIREEAWKQQEIERHLRDEEMRTEETSRSLALISFIQNFLGHEIKLPKPCFEASCLEKYEGEISNYEDSNCNSNNGRWPKAEVQGLITVRAALDHKFLFAPKGAPVWEEVSLGL